VGIGAGRNSGASEHPEPLDDRGGRIGLVRRLAQDKVLAMSGDMFEMPGYFRLSITATDDMVERAIPVFEKAISETR